MSDCCECLQGYMYKGAIGLAYAMSPMDRESQQDHDLVHHRDKVHPVSSLVGALRAHARLHHSIGDKQREGSAEVESRV